jgi:hypothetical protein
MTDTHINRVDNIPQFSVPMSSAQALTLAVAIIAFDAKDAGLNVIEEATLKIFASMLLEHAEKNIVEEQTNNGINQIEEFLKEF